MNPAMMIGTGALFALSFDTFSQVALFSLSAHSLSGGSYAAFLALVFTVGMMLSDGLNGLLVSKLLRNSQRRSQFLYRLTSLGISAFSFSIALLGLWELFG
jgi:nickel/cobalt transporter (NiCoT) family protein